MPEGVENLWRVAANIYKPVDSKRVDWSDEVSDLYLEGSSFDSYFYHQLF